MIKDILHSPEQLRSIPLTYPEKQRCATVDEAVKNISFALRGVEAQEMAKIAQQREQELARIKREQAFLASMQTKPETPEQAMANLTEVNAVNDSDTRISLADNEMIARRAVEEAMQ